jgi:hypothetical protein
MYLLYLQVNRALLAGPSHTRAPTAASAGVEAQRAGMGVILLLIPINMLLTKQISSITRCAMPPAPARPLQSVTAPRRASLSVPQKNDDREGQARGRHLRASAEHAVRHVPQCHTGNDASTRPFAPARPRAGT